MEILNKLKSNENLAIALGFFDGVHLGHKAVINAAVDYAKKNNIKSAVVTFRQSPYVALNNVKPNYIITLEEKIKAIKKLGVDYLYLSDFTEDLAKQTASDYLKNLVDDLHPKMIATGFNHYFGYNKSGGVDYLRLMQQEYGYEFKEINPIKLNEDVISSTAIRKALSNGDIPKANSMLGYRFYVKNEVIKGRQIGRTIGFKTANLKMPEKMINIPDGVYAVEVEVLGKKYMGIAIRLFHCPHLFNQRLFFLSADCPYRQDQLHSEQYQNEQPHFQNRELIRHYISGKSTYTHFSASKDGSRKPNDQRCQCCKERIAQPLTDVHFT